ncbi:hypothetical protein JYU34_003099 [Plutella xylostella]|uniref:GPR158/179 extracellular domain-containing protein n=1 Tax=Plutella xylostella TaxID=51655 RepID=A0ABQ7QZ51_PLUXY|nr:hypothetical protein JYU34_003099 [Plutella xylostella]
MRSIALIYFATLVHCDYRSEVKPVRHPGRTLIRHARSRSHLTRLYIRKDERNRDLLSDIEAERSSELESFDKSGEEPVIAALRPYGAADDDVDGPDDAVSGPDSTVDFHTFFGNFTPTNHEHSKGPDENVSPEHYINVEPSYDSNNETYRIPAEDILKEEKSDRLVANDSATDNVVRTSVHEDVVTKFLRLIETQHLLGENCTAGTDLNLGEGVVDRYAQERFRIEADVAVNRANMLTRLWKYAGPSVMHNEYLLHASVFSMVEFDDDIFAAGNCYDQYQYKDYQLFCPFAYRLPEGPILAKDLAVEYKYLSNTSEWFYIARKNAERVIRNHNQFRRGYNTYTYNDTAHTSREPDEILSVSYEDGKWSKPYYDCGGGNIWMLTYTVPFFGYSNGTYFFKGTSGIDIDLRRVDIDQCPLESGSKQLNIFAGTDKCKKTTTECVPVPGLGFRRGSYRCHCRRGFYFPNTTAPARYYNGSDIEEEYEKHLSMQSSLYSTASGFECVPCAEGCDACDDGSPCVAALNWVVRTTIFALACLVISCLPIIVWFTIKYGHVRTSRDSA